MIWQNSHYLWLLAVLPLLALLMLIARQRARSVQRRFAAQSMLGRLLPESNSIRALVKSALLLCGLLGLLLALARPRFGQQQQEVVQRGIDLFVLLDVSRSMLAEDVQPNRLERAKSDVLDLLARLRGDRAGLIVFAGTPVLKVPLTNDLGFYRMVLEEVDCDAAPRGGSLVGDAIRKALETMEPRKDRDQVLVLISDGEDHDSFPVDAARQARERGIAIITVGLGDPHSGARIPRTFSDGTQGFVQHDGHEVRSQLNETVLRQVASETSGAYIPARTRAYDLGQVYDQHLADLTRSTITTEEHTLYRERYQWFAGFGFACLLIELTIAPFRRRVAPVQDTAVSSASRRATAIMTGLLAMCLLGPATAWGDARLERLSAGLESFHAGDYAEAAKALGQVAEEQPEDMQVAFDYACALAANKQWEEAESVYLQVSLSDDLDLAANAFYNLGAISVARARNIFGKAPEAADPSQRKQGTDLLLAAVDRYREALRLEPNHEAARHNLETLRLWIKQMQATWRERDRQQRLQELDFHALLRDIETRQLHLLDQTYAAHQNTAQPLLASQRRAMATAQQELTADLDLLEEKAAQGLQSAEGDSVAAVSSIIDAARAPMKSAHQQLQPTGVLEQAIDDQRAAVEPLNELFQLTAPFPDVLRKAIAEQSELLKRSRTASTALTLSHPLGSPSAAADGPHQSWKQARVTGWSRWLPELARQTLETLPEEPSDMSTADPVASLRQSLDNAIELAPQVTPLSEQASKLLDEKQFAQAAEPQSEALELLKRIAQTLPPPDNQQQNQQQQNQQQQDQQQQDQQQQDQQQQNQQQQNQQQQNQQQQNQQQQNQQQQNQQQQNQQQQNQQLQDQQQQDQQEPDQQQQDQQQQNQQEQDQEGTDVGEATEHDGQPDARDGSAQVQRGNYSREQAMAILRRARQRAAEYREREKELRQRSSSQRPVSKDW